MGAAVPKARTTPMRIKKPRDVTALPGPYPACPGHDSSPLQPLHHWTTSVTGMLTGCTLELELVAVTVIVKVPGGVPCGGGGGGAEPPPQPMQSSTASAPVAKAQRGISLWVLAR
jgi:hypothetical protein